MSKRIIGSKELVDKVPYTIQHIWRLEQAGKFPQRIKLGPNRIGWRESEVDTWIDARAAETNGGKPAAAA